MLLPAPLVSMLAMAYSSAEEYTMRPSEIVYTTSVSEIDFTSQASRFWPRTTKSTCLPTWIVPERSSIKAAYAPLDVYIFSIS